VQFDDSRGDFAPYGLTCVLWSPTRMPRPDRHNEIEGNFLRSGSLTYLLGGRRTTFAAGRLVLFWAGMPHQIVRWETNEPYYVLTLPLGWFRACGFPDHFAHPVTNGEIVSDPAATPGDEKRLARWLDDFRSSNPVRERVAQLEIQARLLRLALALPARSAQAETLASRGPDPTLSRADQIANYIAMHYAEPLTTQQIAKAVHLHPNYAMGLFRKAFGTTMVRFLVQHRLSHAQRLLVTTDDPIIDVAAASGFQSLSRFNEAFKRSCGCAPRDYRKAHRPTP
jgi:AraC-like DNA-binding protein